jgi:RHS repeat-associated protein
LFFPFTSHLLMAQISNVPFHSINGNLFAQQQVNLQAPNGKMSSTGNAQGRMYIDKTINVVNTYNPNIITNANVRPHDKNLAVGSIDGAATVDLGGNANYSFTIPLPPSTNNMMPTLSFNYNSALGDGIMGMGWDISATSVISRVNDDIYHDDNVDPFNFNTITPNTASPNIVTSDKLVLDGNRMVPQGNDANSEYHYFLENETFAKIINKGSYFEVIEKSGIRKEYGRTADSKQNILYANTTRTIKWYLNKVYDNYGNYIEYKYNNNTNLSEEITLKEINYTGNSNSGLNPYNSIKFYYNTKTFPTYKYIKGHLLTGVNSILREVEVFSEGNSITQYAFNYSYNKYNYLNEVAYINRADEKYNSTAFIYGINTSNPSITSSDISLDGNLMNSYPSEDYVTTDFNGDGKTDMLSLQYPAGSMSSSTGYKLYGSFKLRINNSIGTTASFITTQTVTFPSNNALLPFQGFYNHLFGQASGPDAIQIGDINGDGYADLVLPRQKPGTNFVKVAAYLFNPQTQQLDEMTLPSGPNPAQGCLPANSYFEYRIPSTYINNANQATPGGFTSCTMGDFNGDGKQELLAYYRDNLPSNGSHMSIFFFDIHYTSNKLLALTKIDASLGGQFKVKTLINTMESIQRYSGFSSIDFDGDGKSELMGYYTDVNNNKRRVILRITGLLYNQSGINSNNPSYCNFGLEEVISDAVTTTNDDIFNHGNPADLNGDGNLDFVAFKENETKVCYGKGIALESVPTVLPNVPGRRSLARKLMVFDVDNDGKSDIIELFSNASGQTDVKVGMGKDVRFNGLTTIGSVTGILPDNRDYAHELCDYDYDGSSTCSALVLDPEDIIETNLSKIPFYHIGDFNGDGYNDILLRIGAMTTSAPFYYYSKVSIIYLYPNSKEKYIVKVLDGYNRETEFFYSNLSQITQFRSGVSSVSYPLAMVQRPMNVVTGMSSTGIQVGNSTIASSNQYSYKGMVVHLQGKGMLGFSKITTSNSLLQHQLTSEYQFDNTFYYPYLYQSKLIDLNSQNNNLLLSTTTNTYSNLVLSGPNSGITYFKKRFFTKLDNSANNNLLRGIITTDNFLYDNDGNITKKEIVTNSGSNNSISTATYSNPIKAGSWINNTFTTQNITEQYQNNPIHSRTSSNTFNLQKGNLLSLISDVGTLDEVVTSYTYDPTYGTLTQTVINAPSDPNTLAKTVNIVYDPLKRLPTKQISDLNYVTESIYDFTNGHVLSSKEANGLISTNQYDFFGKLKKSISPDGISTSLFYNWFNVQNLNSSDPVPLNPAFTLYNITKKITGRPDQTLYYDMRQQLVKVEGEGFNGQVISNTTWYDSKGNSIFQTADYPIPLPPGQKVIWTKKYYSNNSNELQSSITSDGSVTNTNTTNYAYNYNTTNGELTTTVSFPDGTTKSKTIDFTNKEIKSTDNGGNVSFQYNNSFGKINNVSINGVTASTATFDNLGRTKQINEVNSGSKTFNYNAFGQILSFLDANNVTSVYQYDVLGRTINESIGSEQFSYNYNNSGIGIGQIDEVMNITNNVKAKYFYDNLARSHKKEVTINGQTYNTSFEFDNLGRISKQSYPNSFKLRFTYTPKGYPLQVLNDATNQILWQAIEVNHLGQYTKFTLGNGIQSVKSYNDFGVVQNCNSGGLENITYDVNNKNGNLNSITDNVTGNLEKYKYDNLDRLTSMKVNTDSPKMIGYDPNGNITSKWDVGNMLYDNTKIHQVTSAANSNNEIDGNQQDIAYNTYNQPIQIEEGNRKAVITYGYGKERIQTQFFTKGNVTKNRYYLNEFEFETDANGNIIQELNYVNSPAGLIGIYVSQGGNQMMYYTYQDHLGSITKVTDNSGNLVYDQNFDAWGRQRDNATLDYSSISASPSWLCRGYTGHEMLPEFNLINMNGRMYDPILGRMLSPDPVLAQADNTQAYNKYSYVNNNPLKFTDPSGNFIEYGALALFAVGNTATHLLNRPFTEKSERESVGDAFKNGAGEAYYAFTQIQSLMTYDVSSGSSGNTSYSVTAQLTMGMNGIGVGLNANFNHRINFKNGTRLNLGATIGGGLNTNGPAESVINTQGFAGGGIDFGTDDFYGGIYVTQYFSEGSSQRLEGQRLGGKNWSVSHENDMKFFGLGDGGDHYRTAALKFTYKDLSVGFNLMTEKRQERMIGPHKLYKVNGNEWKLAEAKSKDIQVGRKDIYSTNPEGRLGGLYVGYKNNHIGINSDGVRNTIQNQIVHNTINSPHFINQSYGVQPYGGYWLPNKYSLW